MNGLLSAVDRMIQYIEMNREKKPGQNRAWFLSKLQARKQKFYVSYEATTRRLLDSGHC